MHPVSLSALSVGYLAADRLASTADGIILIHSRFQHTLNLQLADGILLSLVSANNSLNHPDALRIAVPDDHDWRATPEVNLHQDVFMAPDWQCAMHTAAVWQPVISGRINTSALPFLSQRLREWCQQHNVVSALQLQPDDVTGRPVSIDRDDSASTLSLMADKIIGFGGGLTPDGDDYLVGYLAALSSSPHRLMTSHRQRLATVIKPRLNRTNDISRHYLRRAVEGHFSESLCRLLAVLSTSYSPQNLRHAAEGVMAFGTASGADCMAGFLHGLRTLSTLPG